MAITYVSVAVYLLIIALVTAKFPIDDAPVRVISLTQFVTGCGVNAVFLVGLLADGHAIWRHPPCIRRGPLVGVVFCVVSLLLLQLAMVFAYGPFIGR